MMKSSVFAFTALTFILAIAQSQKVSAHLADYDFLQKLRLLGYGVLGLQEVLLPVSFFIGALLVYRRAWRAGFIETMLACGHHPVDLMRGLIILSIPVAVLTAIMAHSVGPESLRTLRNEFVSGFENGVFNPLRHVRLKDRGILQFLGDDDAVVGVATTATGAHFLSATNSRFIRASDTLWLKLQGVTVDTPTLELKANALRIRVPELSKHAFPSVLRGTKLLPTVDLNFSDTAHKYACIRRCFLVLSVWLLMLYAFLLPGITGDMGVGITSLCLVVALHLLFRMLELWALNAIFTTLILCMFFGVALLVWWRAYERRLMRV